MSQQFIQEYNRMISVEEELKQKLQQSEAQLRTIPQNVIVIISLDPGKSCSNEQILLSLTEHRVH